MITRDRMTERTAELRRALASDTLPQAIGRGSRLFGGAAFDALLANLHANPADDGAWQAACEQWAMYGALLREKAESNDPRL